MKSENDRCVFFGVGVALFALLFAPSVHADESIPGVDSYYHDIEVSDGATLRAIVTLPAGDTAPRHPLLFTQWVSCGSVEYNKGSGSRELLAALARDSGLALIRVERSAVSGGPSCEQLDFDTEFAHYLEAFTQLLDNEHVDSSKLYIFGSSLGANTAPLIADALQQSGYDIAGIMVQGGGGYTYLERMMNFDRIYLERRPDVVSPADIHEQVLTRVRFQYEYLVRGRHPDEIAGDNAAMRAVRDDTLGLGENDHYGRPYEWHQQIAKRNFMAAWQSVDAPVLVIFNEYDQYESRGGHAIIADIVNRLRPGTATFIERAGIGHSDFRYPTIIDAYAGDNGEPAWEAAAEIILDWLHATRESGERN